MNLLLYKFINFILIESCILNFVFFDETNTNSIEICVYTYGTENIDVQFNLWKYSPTRSEGNGLPTEGDYLITQGYPDETGKILWNNGEYLVDISEYGPGFYGINQVIIDTEIMDCNWIEWDDNTYVSSFHVSDSNTYIELICIDELYEIVEDEIIVDYIIEDIDIEETDPIETNIEITESSEIIFPKTFESTSSSEPNYNIYDTDNNIEEPKPVIEENKISINRILIGILSISLSLAILYLVIKTSITSK